MQTYQKAETLLPIPPPRPIVRSGFASLFHFSPFFGAAENRGFALPLVGGAFLKYGEHQRLHMSLELFRGNPQDCDP
jgi:hypothetical protein